MIDPQWYVPPWFKLPHPAIACIFGKTANASPDRQPASVALSMTKRYFTSLFSIRS
jgi:hypothetical protein